MSETQSATPEGADLLPQLAPLAEFRYQIRAFLSFSEQRAEALGITAQQYQMLQVVVNSGSCSISHLASRLMLRHNSAVELVDRAERSGLVKRMTDTADLRRSMLAVSPHGRGLLDQLVREHVEYLRHEGVHLTGSLERVVAAEPMQELGQ